MSRFEWDEELQKWGNPIELEQEKAEIKRREAELQASEECKRKQAELEAKRKAEEERILAEKQEQERIKKEQEEIERQRKLEEIRSKRKFKYGVHLPATLRIRVPKQTKTAWEQLEKTGGIDKCNALRQKLDEFLALCSKNAGQNEQKEKEQEDDSV